MPGRLDNHVIAITGATGIAAAAAGVLHREGASVFTISIDPDECAALHVAIDGAPDGGETPGVSSVTTRDASRHGWAVADLRNEAQAVAAFAACVERFGRLDGLLAVAGGSGRRFGDGAIDTMTMEAWSSTIDLNLTTTFLAMREAVRHMVDTGGSIAVVSSVLATRPSAARFGTHAYAAAKGAQQSLVLAAAATYADRGIRVNGIAPAVVATPMAARAQTDPEITGYVRRKQPLAGGFLPAESVADLAAFLLSDDAEHVTGQIIAVDGGWSITEVER